jgi:large subunit ribosomal protein L2
LLNYIDGEKRYIVAPQGLQVGAVVVSGDDVAPEIGNALQLKNMPLGTMVHNIEMQPGHGGVIARSAGSSAQLTNKEEKYAILKMPSGELRKVLINCLATVG